jgi:type I restriction enzyme S subunit
VKDGDKPDIGDVLFTKDGTVGKTLVFNQKIDLVLLSSIAIIRRSEKLDSDYCNYLLQSKFMVKHLAKFFGGTAIKRIILKHLDLFEFPLPPIIEQQKIASVLSKIDEQIKYLEIHLSKLKTMRKTIINEKLTLPKLEEKPLVQ